MRTITLQGRARFTTQHDARGWSVDTVVLDRRDAMPENVVEHVTPCIMASPVGEIVYA